MRGDTLWFGFAMVGEYAANTEEEKLVTYVSRSLNGLLRSFYPLIEVDYKFTPADKKAMLKAAREALAKARLYGERVRMTVQFEWPSEPVFVADIQHGLPDLLGN